MCTPANGITYFNQVICAGKIIGKSGERLELKEVIRKNGEKIVDREGNQLVKIDFTVAVLDTSRPKDENGYYQSDKIRCTAFGALAQHIAEHFFGQSGILIVGKETTSTYEKNGEKRYATSVLVQKVRFNGTRLIPDEDVGEEALPEDAAFAAELEIEGLPFK